MIDKKSEIYRCGKEIFSAKGFKDTNVTDITQMAGIAAGTFYIYFKSKDELFMDIFLEENVKLKRSIVANTDLNREPLDVVRQLMFLNYKGISSNTILKEWYNRDLFSKIEKKYREENGLERVGFMYDFFIDLVRNWQAEGKMINDIDPEMIMAIFGALINIDTHKEEIGFQYFPEVLDRMTGFVMKCLTDIRK